VRGRPGQLAAAEGAAAAVFVAPELLPVESDELEDAASFAELEVVEELSPAVVEVPFAPLLRESVR